MATIYDVAELAKVSISTVSKYINNKYIGPDKRERIKKAIEQINYTPNSTARKLRTCTSKEVAIILPNIQERIYNEILATLNYKFQSDGYKTILYLTDDMKNAEVEALGECLNNNIGGMILCTCDPSATELFHLLQKKIPLVFLFRKPKGLDNYNFISFDNYDTIYSMTCSFLKSNHKDIILLTGPQQYSFENDCIKAYEQAFKDNNIPINKSNIMSMPISKDTVFKKFIELFSNGFRPSLILTTSMLMSTAIAEAAFFQGIKLNEDLFIITLGEEAWYNVGVIQRILCSDLPAQQLASQAYTTLLDNMKSPIVFEAIHKYYNDRFDFNNLRPIIAGLNRHPKQKLSYKKKLKILIMETNRVSANVLKCFIPYFSEIIKAEIEPCIIPVNELYQKLLEIESNHSPEFDIIQLDVTWLAYFASQGCLFDLTDIINANYLNNIYVENALSLYCGFNNRIYGIPAMHGTQLLYYRKDIFEDTFYSGDFYSKYRKKLLPPKTWFDYNLISKYFTKKFNPGSPFKYGTLVARNFPEAMSGELFPRIWGYGGSIFNKDGKISLNSEENISAIKNIIESISCSDPDTATNSPYENTVNFAQGKAAMIIAYHSHASVLSDRTISKISGNIGYSLIPGEKSVLAGFNMCINNYSNNINTAIDFIKSFSEAQISNPYAMLTGNSVKESTYTNPEIQKLYPWFDIILEASKFCTPRSYPLINGRAPIPEPKIEKILGHVVFEHLKTGASIEKLLKEAQNEIKKLFEENGYVEPSSFINL